MPWQQRIKEAAYTAPDGTRQTFIFSDVRKNFDKKTSVFEFPDVNGSYIQDLGRTGFRYPFDLIFSGDNHDIEADSFESLLSQKGVGRLEHPLYGVIDVVPFGSISRMDSLVSEANQTTINVTFFETTGLVYPNSQINPQGAVAVAIDVFNQALGDQFTTVDIDTAVERVKLKSSYQVLLDNAAGGLRKLAETKDSIADEFNAILDSINQGLDILISDPLTLAFQTAILIQAPSRAVDNVDAKLNAYSDLSQSIIEGDGSVRSQGYDSTNENDFHVDDLFASSYISAMASSVIYDTFDTKPQAIEAAETILSEFEKVYEWRENNFESLEVIDTGESYQQLQKLVSLTAGYLVEISFTLKQEKTIVLDRDRSIIDLVYELYGDIDDNLDFFINSNNLSGSQILELERGTTIVYYI